MFERLEATITERLGGDTTQSYVAKLAADPPLAARKVGEEAVELVVAALAGERRGVVAEAADLVFHLLVVLGIKGIGLHEVEAELAKREGVSGLVEKASRQPG